MALSRRHAISAFALSRQAASSSQPDRFALLSDTHISEDKGYRRGPDSPHENLLSTLRAVSASGVRECIINGDLALERGTEKDYRVLHETLGTWGNGLSYFFTLGNHDHRKTFLEVTAHPAESIERVPSRFVSVLERSNVVIVLLDSLYVTNEAAGLLGKAQRTWLRRFLQKQRRPVVIFVHHTLDDDDVSLLDSYVLNDLIARERSLKAIFYGHSHRPSLRNTNGVHLVNLPAVAYTFAPTENRGWMLAGFQRDGVEIELLLAGQAPEKKFLAWRR